MPVVAEVGSTANNYQILAKLAMGGMAEIFLARGASAAGVERYVVLKRIIREKANDSHFVQMFLEEARLAAQLQHANIAQVYDIGKLGDSYFFTMEYVHGETVRGLLQRARSLRRELPLNVVLTVIAGAAAGLHYAHDRLGLDGRHLGVVHRDVSPSNLMISYDGGVKVVDFGVAKAENRAQETRSGAVKGKISYLSPEQCMGHPVDRRSDLFSLGIVLWEMLTVERLYRRASDFENMTAIVNEPTPSPSQYRANLPWDLEQLALKLLAKRAEDRFQSAQELIEHVEELAARNGLVLSTSALGKFMKELFGQRPEPWIELETRDAAEGVTVTSEPLSTASSISDPVEGQLKQVRDLSRQYAAQHHPPSESRPPTGGFPTGMMTSPALPATALDDHPTMLDQQPARSAQVPVSTVSLRPSQPPPLDLAKTIQYRPAEPAPIMPPRPHTPSAPPPMSYPVAPRPIDSGTGSISAYGNQQPALPSPPSRKTNVIVILAVAAASVAVGIVVWVLASGAKEPASTTTEQPVATTKDDAGRAATADAAETAAVPVDADETIAAVPIDAAAPVAAQPDRVEVIKTALAEGRIADALKACSNDVGTESIAGACTRAACRAGDLSRAKQWLAKAGGGAKAVIADCRKDGMDLARKSTTKTPKSGTGDQTPKPDPCKTDPMACQR